MADQKNARRPSKEMQGGRAKVKKKKMQGGRAKVKQKM
jgi:hypothetical protein